MIKDLKSVAWMMLFRLSNPINAVLNFGYSILAQQFSEILIKRGFEISIGFLHTNESSKRHWNQLSWDFIEPYRIWIDNTIKDMIADQVIKPTDLTFSEDKSHMVFKEHCLEIALNNVMKIL